MLRVNPLSLWVARVDECGIVRVEDVEASDDRVHWIQWGKGCDLCFAIALYQIP